MSSQTKKGERMTSYYAGKPTGSWYEGGGIEIGNTCGHKHRSIETAQRCADSREAPGFSEWHVYDYATNKEAVPE